MALADSTARKQAEEPALLYRSAPHNIEAEQALLGAILVNNEAFYRVSHFLEPVHFFEPIHQKLGWNQMNGGKLTVAESVGRRTLALPFFTRISEEQQESVASSFATALGKR